MMRAMIVTAAIAGCVGGAALAVMPGAASAQGGEATTAQLAPALSVTYSADLLERFEDTYGVREKVTLEAEISRRVGPLLARGYQVDVELLDVRPNRPTFKELGDRPGLSFQSFGLGGASLRATVRSPDGRVAEPVSYSWYEHDIVQSAYQSTWGDANTAIDRFARQLMASVSMN
ncbi:MAG: hypothetical protein MUF14_02290 [Hyphomonadaceae bacterium]|nr:hypothetical protein [Hyphomonadaceae bacterium]